MKRNSIYLSGLLVVLLSIAMLGCGGETINAPSTQPLNEDPNETLVDDVGGVAAGSSPTVGPGAFEGREPTSPGALPAGPSSPQSSPSAAPALPIPAAGSEGMQEDVDGQSAPPVMVESGGIPCDVKEILNDGCATCHSSAPAFGAPMSLETYEDLMAPALTDPSRTVYDLVLERAQDPSRPMPPAPYERLEAPQLQTLTTWENSGFPTSEEACEVSATDQVEDGDYFATLPTGDRCSIELDLTANSNGGGYPVPLEDDHYECFYFDAPDTDVFQITGLAPIIDDERTLHHWLIYYTTRTDVVPGTHESCTGIHPEDTLLGGWAPGGETLRLPDDVGLRVPPGSNTRFIVEFHYNNIARITDSVDASGVRVCATSTPQENEAAIHWLGTENIFLFPGGETKGTSTCTPKDEVNILSVTPHLHELGTHSSIIINRADGTKETLIDKPFDFNTQIGYKTPAKLMPGDTLTSTCTWNNTSGALVGFGEGTSDEMCYLFTLAYPIGPLDTGGDLLGVGLIGGTNKCMH